MGNNEIETNQRCAIFQGMNSEIIASLQTLFHEHNCLIKLFKFAMEEMPSNDYQIVIRADKVPSGEHERRFNSPSIDEIAIVTVGTEFERRDIVLRQRDAKLKRVAETHRWYDALQYPILFWKGEDGYHFHIMQSDNEGEPTAKRVSSMHFYAYRIMIRAKQSNHILRCGKLFHQFIVDMYAKTESERLWYLRKHQLQLRADSYIHLRDAITNERNVTDIGQMVILPATYTGSPRHMHEYAQDALTYVQRYGRPDLFITFTCNPTWSEITERHDIIARVFKQTLIRLMNVITKTHVFGENRC